MMETILLVISVALLLCWLAYQKLTSKWGIFAERGVAFNKPRLVLGNFELTNNFVNTIQDIYDKYRDEKVTGFFTFVTPAFLVKDVDLIKQITIKDFDSFVNHDKMFDENIDKIFGRSLVLMRDEKWRVMRNTLSPIFTSSKMKMMFGMVSECSDDFVAHFEKKAKEGKVIINAKDTFARYTVDGISTAALGFKGDCIDNEDSSLFKMAIGFSKPNLKSKIKMMMAIMARPLYELLGLQLFTGEVRTFFHRAIVDVMHEREAKNIFRPDIIQLLIQTKKGKIEARDKDDGKDLQNFSANIEYDVGVKNRKVIEWTDDDFIAQGFIFFGAGFDSTSNLLQFMSYELAKNSEVQAELIEEVDEVLKASDGKPVSYEALHKMKFLDQVVSEVLRLSPPGPFATRECNKDYKMNLGNGREVLIKKGENVLIPVMAIHRDSKYYENPETFDPRRFDDDKKDSIVPGSFIPFGSGPRTCIGSRFALMVVKLLIFNILCKFTIEVCDKTPDKIEATATFGVAELKKEIFVEFKPRQQDR